MKIIKTLILSLIFGLLVVSQTHAEVMFTNVNSQNSQKKTTFDLKVIDILKSQETDLVQFNFALEQVSGIQNIAYYRVFSNCDSDMSIQVGSNVTEGCDSPVIMAAFNKTSFPIYFTNNTNKLKKFNFKVKAYDITGKWLHTEKEAFYWK